jgi:hypothetical protein
LLDVTYFSVAKRRTKQLSQKSYLMNQIIDVYLMSAIFKSYLRKPVKNGKKSPNQQTGLGKREHLPRVSEGFGGFYQPF